LNHNTPKAFPPPPPAPLPSRALPRFELPSDVSAGGEDDPLDVAVTTQRPVMDAARALRVLKPAAPTRPQADGTSEVQVEDILLEVYAEPAPPPSTRRSVAPSPELRPPPLPAQVSIAQAIASAVPPAPAESAAVDALLRASDPAFLPFGGAARPATPASPFMHAYAPAYAYAAADQESPSVAPVAFPSGHMAVASHVPGARQPSSFYPDAHVAAPPARRGATFAIGMAALVVLGLVASGGVAVGVRNGTFAELRDRAKTLSSHGEPKAAAATQAEAAPVVTSTPPQPPTVAAAPAAPVAAPAPAPVSVDSLPAEVIPADSTLVTFPASAQGHRVFFDGRPMAVPLTPVKLRCGRHMIRIGSAGRPRVTDLACGQSITLR
jgi:hypothetical protein